MSSNFDLGDYEDVVARRARLFAAYPTASIQTTPPEYVARPNGEFVIRVTAIVYRDPFDPRPGVDSSEEPYPGKTPYTRDSEAENAATSAIGRAINCVLPGQGASQQEVAARQGGPTAASSAQKQRLWEAAKANGYTLIQTGQQVAALINSQREVTTEQDAQVLLSSLTTQEASDVIDVLEATATHKEDDQ